jgi:serine/threonine-protein kinase HipA
MRTVARVVAGWREHFKGCGVTSMDVDLLAAQIDWPFLKDQRDEALAKD